MGVHLLSYELCNERKNKMKVCVALICALLLTTQSLSAMENKNNKKEDKRTDPAKVLQAVFYKPVKKFLNDELDEEGRRLVGNQISEIEYHWPKSNNVDLQFLAGSKGLLEMTTHLSDKHSMRTAMLPIPKNQELVVVHAFFKHADIQNEDISIAKERARDYLNQQKENAEKDNDKKKDTQKSGRIFKKIGTRK